MKSTFIRLAFMASVTALVFSACQKSNDLSTNTSNDAALQKNKQQLHSTLQTTDLSAKVPDDNWWSDEDAEKPASSSQNSVAQKFNDPRGYLTFSYLDSALAFTGLDAVLADPNTQYTLFAPNDNAFKNAGFATIGDLLALGKDALTQILLYHVTSGKVFAADIPLATNTAVASLQGDTLYLTKKQNQPFFRKASVDGVGVYIADIDLGNGVMHDINKVLMYPSGNIVETAIANPDYTYLVAAIVRASTGSTDVAGVLSGPGPFTVFGPTNQAFINAGFATIDDINNADPDVLASILTYHVVAARVFACDVKNGDTPTMLDGNTTLINRTGSLFDRQLSITGINNPSASNIVKKNILATNGVIHVIDQVLLP